MLAEGHLGIHPPGALGVAFFMHAGAECFIGLTGDGITQSLKEAGSLALDDNSTPRSVSLKGRVFSNLLEADAQGRLPELLLVCCNPDQLHLFTAAMTRFLESLAERDRLHTVEDIRRNVPITLILPNGILAEQTLHTYAEQLNEASLVDRLPGVNAKMIQSALDRVVRGVSLQAGGRRGSGRDTVYVLERKGSLVFAGGGEPERDRVEAILGAHDYPGRHIRGVPATRIEFDKAMISIVLNVGGLIHAVRPDGSLVDLRMGDLCNDASKQPFVDRVTRAVFDVGRASGAYFDSDSYDAVWAEHRATILKSPKHVTSSLQAFHNALDRGLDSVRLFSNEEWILTAICRYAAKAGMTKEEELFTSLRHDVQASMAKAIRRRQHADGDNGHGARTMKLSAQRNIAIELFQTGTDDLVLVGTMLDTDHLIKLELTIHIPDEQITRSRLEMVRAPFPVCREVEGTAQRLVGLRIERGVIQEIGDRIGGRGGCSHIKELATNIVYFVASFLVRRRAGTDPFDSEYVRTPPDEQFRRTKDFLRDSCLAYCQTTSEGLDEHIGIRRVGDEHRSALPLGDYEPSLGVLLRSRAQRWGDKVYLRYRRGDGTESITWTQFGERVSQIARHLIDLNIRPGDRIAMLCENRWEMYMAELATVSIGALSVPIFAGHRPRQVAYVLDHSRPRFVIVSDMHQLEKIDRGRHTSVERYYCIDFTTACARWGALDFASLTGQGGASGERLDERVDAVKPDDQCLIMYTSGTTGPPKGVQLCHANLISQQKALSLLWDVDDADVFMSYLPWHHSFGGLFERLMSLYHGCELCLDDSCGRDIERLLENWRTFNPTLFFSVPHVHDLLVSRCREDEQVSRLVFSGRLRFVFTAAAPLPARVESAYRDHDIPVMEGWGLTETSPCVTVRTREQGWRSGFVGFPIPGVCVRVGSDQEILVKGPNVMAGYLDDEEATAHVLDADGWLHTGDLGEFTADGLRILGRKDGSFKLTTGEIVHPQRIETTLVNESPYIRSALVVGSGQNYVGALIFPDFGRLGEWARAHGVTANPLTDDPAVRDLYAAELERINPMIEFRYQRIKRAVVCGGEPTLESGEMTPSAKLVREKVLDVRRASCKAMFEPTPPKHVIEIRQLQSAEALTC